MTTMGKYIIRIPLELIKKIRKITEKHNQNKIMYNKAVCISYDVFVLVHAMEHVGVELQT